MFLALVTAGTTAYTEDFESFIPGEVVHEIVPGNGYIIDVVAKGCSQKAMIFNSDLPTGSDSDLVTPGPGVNNNVPKDNILIVSEDGDSSDPDDCGYGGVLKFKFDPPAFASSVGLLDVEEGARILVFNPSGSSYPIDVPSTTDNGYVSVPINDVVSRINVKFFASGAVTELEYEDCPFSGKTGIVKDVPEKLVTDKGWNQCWAGTYNTDISPATQDQIEADCQGTYIMYGCRRFGSSNWKLLGYGHRDKAFTPVPAIQQAAGTQDGNIQWYNADAYSMGFAPAGLNLFLNQCDTNSVQLDRRMCWHTLPFPVGGWSCGDSRGLNNGSFERRVWVRA